MLQQIAVSVLGQGGIPSKGASAVVLNLTVTEPTRSGYLTAFPSGVPAPTASNLNFVKNQVIANQVSIQVANASPDPQWTYYAANVQNNAGTVQVIADLNGWFGPES